MGAARGLEFLFGVAATKYSPYSAAKLKAPVARGDRGFFYLNYGATLNVDFLLFRLNLLNYFRNEK
jgi:hypothetical protein